jgi:hypothetical protein
MTKRRATLPFASGGWWSEQQVNPLRSKDFLWNLVASADLMRLSLRKGAHAVLSGAAWQEIRLRFGR